MGLGRRLLRVLQVLRRVPPGALGERGSGPACRGSHGSRPLGDVLGAWPVPFARPGGVGHLLSAGYTFPEKTPGLARQ